MSLPKKASAESETILFVREYWTGNSRDGGVIEGEGYLYYRMAESGKLIEAYESYEDHNHTEIAGPCPSMENINWFNDLGYKDLELLETIDESEFERIKELAKDYIPPDNNGEYGGPY